jgi:2-succinyl-6-hydroxy-2,4-cyclohexadiene-1-carboxylate synthase
MTVQPELHGEIRSILASDGARLEYEVVGSGPPLIMLHGFLSGRRAFSRQRPFLAERFRLITPSGRGHDGSASTVPAEYGAGTSDVDDLKAVLGAEHIDRLSLLGHSSGGATAFVFACAHPDRVARAVLLEPTLLALLDPVEREQNAAFFAEIAATAEKDGPAAALREVMSALGGDAWINLDADQKASRLAALSSCAPLVGPHFRGLADLVVTEPDVMRLAAPTLLLYGAASYPFEAGIARRFRDLRPDLQVVTIDGAGHNIHRDRSDIVNPMVAAFLT